MKSRDRIFCALSVLIVAQVVVMVTLMHFKKRTDETLSKHTVVLASHSTKLDAILDFGFNEKTTNWVKREYDRIKP
jgi:hypothetical protein